MKKVTEHGQPSGRDDWDSLAKDLLGADFVPEEPSQPPPEEPPAAVEPPPGGDRESAGGEWTPPAPRAPVAEESRAPESTGELEDLLGWGEPPREIPARKPQSMAFEESPRLPFAEEREDEDDAEEPTDLDLSEMDDSLPPSADEEEDEEEEVAAPQTKDDSYWDALSDWDWEDEERSAGRQSEARPPHPRREGDRPGRRSREGRPERSRERRAERPERSRPSSGAPRGERRPSRSDSPPPSRSAPPRGSRPPQRERDDFGKGLADEPAEEFTPEPLREAAFESAAPEFESAFDDERLPAGTGAVGRDDADQASEEEQDQGRKRRRRRRRRRGGPSDEAAARRPGEQSRRPAEAVPDFLEEDDEPFAAAEDETAPEIDEEEEVSFRRPAEQPPRESRRRRRRRGRGEPEAEEPRDYAAEDLNVDVDADADVEFEPSEDLEAYIDESPPADRIEPAEEDDDEAVDMSMMYRDVPTWEEAISYLLAPHTVEGSGGGRPSRPSRDSGRGRRRGRGH